MEVFKLFFINEKTHLKHVATLSNKPILSTYRNGNHFTSILEDGTRIRETVCKFSKKLTYDFAESADVLITKKCDLGCSYCHEDATTYGQHADLNLPIFDTWHEGTEMAIGGGNVFEHPDLNSFLMKMKDKKVMCNITVNQKHIIKHYDQLVYLIENKLVKGIGISLVDSSDKESIEAIEKLYTKTNNIVIHVIAGLVRVQDMNFLHGKKVLILGYKDNVGRGVRYKQSFGREISENIEWLKRNLYMLCHAVFQVASFDNLALAQLDAKNTLMISNKEWKKRFQGSDYGDNRGKEAPSTFYFDAVNQMVGRSSTQPYKDRLQYKDQTFKESFEMSLTNYTTNSGVYGELKI